jgi:dihydrofolate synthase / folylpolyglutamate synthase
MSTNHSCEPTEILELFGKRATVIKPGLERIRTALALLGNPGQGTPRIVIAGTNGKGSTSGMLWRMFAAGGVRAGLFSSPHLLEFRERITVSDREVSNSLIVGHIDGLKKRLPAALWTDLTFFEINTILAFVIFDELKTAVNVLEVGLGGRLDCVNVYDGDVTVITSIGMDHEEFLGADICGIAREKSGIMRPGVPIIWGGRGSSEALAHEAIIAAAREIGAPLIEPCFAEVSDAIALPESIKARPLFLRQNFRLAELALKEFLKLNHGPCFAKMTIEGVITQYDNSRLPRPVTLMGRFESLVVSRNNISRTVLVDVCHNPHGARALAHALEEIGMSNGEQTCCCLISVLEDKDAAGIWSEIKSKIREIIRFQIPSPRTWSAEDPRVPGDMKESFAGAWAEAVARENWTDSVPWLICGSVAAVGEVFLYWKHDGWKVEEFRR